MHMSCEWVICVSMAHTAGKKADKGAKKRKSERNASKKRLKRAKKDNSEAAEKVEVEERRASPDQTGSFLRATARTPAEEAAQFASEGGLRLVDKLDPPSEPASNGSAASVASQTTPLEIVELTNEPSEDVLDSVAAVLRDFYEVESAVYAMARRGSGAPKPVFSLRIHSSFRARTVEILDSVHQAAANAGLDAEVLLLDKSHVRSIRTNSLVFFPWRRRA